MYYAIVMPEDSEVVPANMVLLTQGNQTHCEDMCKHNVAVWPKYDVVHADTIFEARTKAFKQDNKPAKKRGVK